MQFLRRIPESLLVWAVAALGSLSFLLLGPYSNYGPAGFLDPWFYTGYFTNLSYLVRHFGPTYIGSRLPWILPGVAAFRFASPEPASVFLNFAIVIVSAVALYWAVRWYYGQPAGAMASVLLVTNPYFMSTVCWDYPDGPAIAYAFAALAFTVRPNGPRVRNTVLAGAFLALSGLTNMSGAPMILAVAAIPLLRERASIRVMARECVYLGAGAAAVTLALCPVSQLIFGRWTYFYWQVYRAFHTFENPEFLAAMWGTGNAFLFHSPRLIAPALLIALAPVYLRRGRKPYPIGMFAFVSLAVCLALYAFQEFVLHGAALRVPYHSSYMVVPLLFFAGVSLGECSISQSEAAVAGAVAVGMTFTFLYVGSPKDPSLMIFAAVGLALVTFVPLRLPVSAVLLAVLMFLSPALDGTLKYAWNRPVPVDGRNVDVFRNLMTLQSALKAAVDPARKVRFWFDRDEPTARFFDSADGLYLWVDPDWRTQLAKGEQPPSDATLVHLTTHPERMAERTQLLASRGIHVGNERRWTMPYGAYTVHVILQDVMPAGSSQ